MTIGNSTNTDADLMNRVCGRDPRALAAIYDQHVKSVYSVCVYITRDAQAAEDLVQELFLRLWNRSEQFDPQKGTLKGWLLLMARHMAIDHLRSGRRNGAHRQDSLECVEISKALASADQSGLRITNISVRGALATLRHPERTVLTLAYFHGYSQREIAHLLGRPLGTVKSWTRSGLDRLRLQIESTLKAA